MTDLHEWTNYPSAHSFLDWQKVRPVRLISIIHWPYLAKQFISTAWTGYVTRAVVFKVDAALSLNTCIYPANISGLSALRAFQKALCSRLLSTACLLELYILLKNGSVVPFLSHDIFALQQSAQNLKSSGTFNSYTSSWSTWNRSHWNNREPFEYKPYGVFKNNFSDPLCTMLTSDICWQRSSQSVGTFRDDPYISVPNAEDCKLKIIPIPAASHWLFLY